MTRNGVIDKFTRQPGLNSLSPSQRVTGIEINGDNGFITSGEVEEAPYGKANVFDGQWHNGVQTFLVPLDGNFGQLWGGGLPENHLEITGHSRIDTNPKIGFNQKVAAIRETKAGDEIILTLKDGSQKRFMVTQVAKGVDPNDVINPGIPELVIYTCDPYKVPGFSDYRRDVIVAQEITQIQHEKDEIAVQRVIENLAAIKNVIPQPVEQVTVSPAVSVNSRTIFSRVSKVISDETKRVQDQMAFAAIASANGFGKNAPQAAILEAEDDDDSPRSMLSDLSRLLSRVSATQSYRASAEMHMRELKKKYKTN